MSSDIREKLSRQQIAETVAELLKPAIAQAIENATRTCITCDHWQKPTELCALYGKRPPAHVIAFGCPAYENEIPF